MNQYRIYFWVGGNKYCTVIGSTCEQTLRNDLKSKYDRFTIEAI